MPEHVLEWTAYLFGIPLVLGLLAYAAEALWIRIDEDRQ